MSEKTKAQEKDDPETIKPSPLPHKNIDHPTKNGLTNADPPSNRADSLDSVGDQDLRRALASNQPTQMGSSPRDAPLPGRKRNSSVSSTSTSTTLSPGDGPFDLEKTAHNVVRKCVSFHKFLLHCLICTCAP